MIEELISKVFATRDITHIFHWRTKSYAEHKALGDFYEALPGAIDSIVEAYQGAFQLVGSVPIAPMPSTIQILPYLENEAAWINANCYNISLENKAIENEIQSLLSEYLSVIYKLRNLR